MKVKQVGGNHYEAEYQHWDWVFDVNMGYHAGCATKYVSRWWKKGGLEDLVKAKSYVEKIIEIGIRYKNESHYLTNHARTEFTNRFIGANNIPGMEAKFIYQMVFWTSIYDLREAIKTLDDLIAIAKGQQNRPLEAPAPVAATTPAPKGGKASPAAAGKPPAWPVGQAAPGNPTTGSTNSQSEDDGA